MLVLVGAVTLFKHTMTQRTSSMCGISETVDVKAARGNGQIEPDKYQNWIDLTL
jgi:hypothetical protein